MDSRLAKLIKDYQSKVADAVALLEAAGIPRPASSSQWTESDIPDRGPLPNGFTYYKHGFGCVVRGPGWGVDFDFGDQGQIDGFDAGRLYDFARRRPSDDAFESEKEIAAALQRTAETGELQFSGYILYYLAR